VLTSTGAGNAATTTATPTTTTLAKKQMPSANFVSPQSYQQEMSDIIETIEGSFLN